MRNLDICGPVRTNWRPDSCKIRALITYGHPFRHFSNLLRIWFLEKGIQEPLLHPGLSSASTWKARDKDFHTGRISERGPKDRNLVLKGMKQDRKKRGRGTPLTKEAMRNAPPWTSGLGTRKKTSLVLISQPWIAWWGVYSPIFQGCVHLNVQLLSQAPGRKGGMW